MASLAQPRVAAVLAGDDHLGVKLDLHRGSFGLIGRLALRAVLLGALCLELLLRLCQSGLPSLAGPQVLGQLIAACLSVELILGRVYL